MRVVIVDDDEDILETTAELIRMGGLDADTIQRVGDILPRLEADPPDLLLQDAHMPGLDLGRLIGTIRAHPRLAKLPILLFTASVQAEDFWKPLGADGLVRKPFNAKALRAAIDGLLGTVRKPVLPAAAHKS